jgi:hypothetical protein
MLIEDDGINYPLIILLFFIIIQKSIPERMTMISLVQFRVSILIGTELGLRIYVVLPPSPNIYRSLLN